MKIRFPQTYTIWCCSVLIVLILHTPIYAQQKNTVSPASVERLLSLKNQVSRFSEIDRKYTLEYAKTHHLPLEKTDKNGNYLALQRIASDGTPIYYTTLSEKVNNTTRTTYIQNADYSNSGLEGTNMHIGIWDAGAVRLNHSEFDNRIAQGDANPRNNLHATHVAGIILAKGKVAKAKGIAPKATGTSFDWYKDEIEVIEEASKGMILSNHSYGIDPKNVPDWYFGSYIYQAYDWDKIMYEAPHYLAVIAAGNSQGNGYNQSPVTGTSADNHDLLIGFSVAKNGLTVGATKNTQSNTDGRLTSAEIASYSSFGPTDDGRIKPDLVAHGSSVYSTGSAHNNAYTLISGTSAATPGVSGTLMLLQQYYFEKFEKHMLAATLKGLVLHTADDLDVQGPDPKTGWGAINAKTAAETIKNKDIRTQIAELELKEGETYRYSVTSDGQNPLYASISWTDAPGKIMVNKLNDTTAALVNDLDIRIYKNGEAYYPWKLQLHQLQRNAKKGDNKVDPYERIQLEQAEGSYDIVVSHKNNLQGGKQAFSLIVSGIDLGIAEQEKIEEEESFDPFSAAINISVTPNPSTDFIKVNNYRMQKGSVYKIISAGGTIVDSNAFENFKPIDVSTLPQGMYVLLLQDDTQSVTQKFYKE